MIVGLITPWPARRGLSGPGSTRGRRIRGLPASHLAGTPGPGGRAVTITRTAAKARVWPAGGCGRRGPLGTGPACQGPGGATVTLTAGSPAGPRGSMTATSDQLPAATDDQTLRVAFAATSTIIAATSTVAIYIPARFAAELRPFVSVRHSP